MITDEVVHVEEPVGGVDLREGGDVEGEAAIWEDDAEHFGVWILDVVVEVEVTEEEGGSSSS